MIALDTNVLLRYMLADDLQQHAVARDLIVAKAPMLVTDVVLVEMVWTLGGPRYRSKKAAICRVLRSLIDDSRIVFENNDAVSEAMHAYEHSKRIGGKTLDFADALIVSKAMHWFRAQNIANPEIYSFDRATSQLAGVRPL